MKLARALANGWLMVFWADAALGLVDEVVALGLGVHLLGWVRGVTSTIVVLSLPFLWLTLGGTRLLPARVFVPPALFLAWMVLGASPLSILLLGEPWMRLAFAGLEAAVAAFVVWNTNAVAASAGAEVQPWILPLPARDGPIVAWRRLGVFLVAHVLLVPPFLAAYTWGSVDLALRRSTAGFVSMGFAGVQVAHRAYARDDRTVDLVGMIHVGAPEAYRELLGEIPIDGAVALEEGVRDEKGLLSNGPTYDRLASTLGVEMQRPVGELSQLETRNADIDVSEFSEDTVKFLRKVLAIHGGDDPAAAILDYVVYVQRQPDPEALVEGVMRDIVDLRNDHLLAELETSLKDHARVVVPWGAYHLPEVEESLLEDGFRPVSERRVTLIPFRAIAGD